MNLGMKMPFFAAPHAPGWIHYFSRLELFQLRSAFSRWQKRKSRGCNETTPKWANKYKWIKKILFISGIWFGLQLFNLFYSSIHRFKLYNTRRSEIILVKLCYLLWFQSLYGLCSCLKACDNSTKALLFLAN